MLSRDQKKTLEKLQSIFQRVKKAFTYVNQREDVWTPLPVNWNGEPFSGNCGEFALACIELCRKEGLAARMLVLQRAQGDWHGVCEVHGYILDNTKGSVVRRDECGSYRFHAISGLTPEESWRLIAG